MPRVITSSKVMIVFLLQNHFSSKSDDVHFPISFSICGFSWMASRPPATFTWSKPLIAPVSSHYSFTKSLVAEFVLLVGRSRNRNEDDARTLFTILFLQRSCCGHLCHCFKLLPSLKSYTICLSAISLHPVADALGKILAEPSLRFCQLLFEVIVNLCHTL